MCEKKVKLALRKSRYIILYVVLNIGHIIIITYWTYLGMYAHCLSITNHEYKLTKKTRTRISGYYKHSMQGTLRYVCVLPIRRPASLNGSPSLSNARATVVAVSVSSNSRGYRIYRHSVKRTSASADLKLHEIGYPDCTENPTCMYERVFSQGVLIVKSRGERSADEKIRKSGVLYMRCDGKNKIGAF